MLRHFEAGLGPSISTIILSKVAVALFVLFAAVCSSPLANSPPLAIGSVVKLSKKFFF